MFLPRGPGSGTVEVGMGGDLDVQVEGGAAALKYIPNPCKKVIQDQLFKWRCFASYSEHTFAKFNKNSC